MADDSTATVQFPEKALNEKNGNILTPLQALERGLSILPESGDTEKKPLAILTGTPPSVSIIEASATALSKYWAALIAALGGAAAITAAVNNFWKGQDPGVRIGLVGGVAGLLIAAVIAISVIVASDVKGRAAGMVALYEARTTIASQFLQQSLTASQSASAVTANVNQAQEPSQNGSAQPSGSGAANQNEELSNAILLYLAASKARAQVLDTKTNQAAYLSGVREVDGIIELFLVRQTDNQSTWRPADEVTVTEFTYSQ